MCIGAGVGAHAGGRPTGGVSSMQGCCLCSRSWRGICAMEGLRAHPLSRKQGRQSVAELSCTTMQAGSGKDSCQIYAYASV